MSEQDDLDISFEAIKNIATMPTLLAVVCKSTNMGFAAVARVTETKWRVCAIRDEMGFELKAGDEVPIGTTICKDVRGSHMPVIISNVTEDRFYKDHPTPKIYNFSSYISVPIFSKGGHVFGTLFALDPKPKELNSIKITGMFMLFADLIGFYLQQSDI